MNITNDIKYVGVNDRQIDLFEGQYVVPNGMAYNSYAILDAKVAVMDTVDRKFTHEWLDNLAGVLGNRRPDYLIVQHMEPDHSANIVSFMNTYPEATVVSSSKAFTMMKNFFGTDFEDRRIVVSEGDTLSLGKHTLTFVTAPMVHWPEVIVTYDSTAKVLFSADGFGKFGALDAEEDWACEARRYYFGIVGKYGVQVQALLKKAAALDIQTICPLHGPVLSENLGYYLNLYNTWSSYGVESEGVVIAYTSVYGNTKKAVELLAEKLKANGCPKVVVNDLARMDMAEAVEDAFRYGKIVLATTTYNADIFPFMKEFINHLTERGFKNKTVGLIENGSWAPQAAKMMKSMLEGCKDITYTDTTVKIMSALNDESKAQIDALAKELTKEYVAQNGDTANKNDLTALFNIGYGLYVPVIAIFAISLLLIVISSAILGADEIAEIFNAPFLSVNATQILVALDLIGVFGALICTLLCFEKSKKEKQFKVADKNDPCKEFERMGNLKKIKIRYAGRIVDAILLGIYTRKHDQFQKTFLEYLFFRKTKSKITTIKQKTYLVFLPWKHQAKQLGEVTEADIIPFEKTFPPEWISVPEYTSIGTDEYCPPMAIQNFRGYSFLFQNNSFIADQVSHEYETNLEILYSEMPELLGEEFDEDIF